MHETLKYPRPAIGYIFGVSATVFGIAAFLTGAKHPLITPTLRVICACYVLAGGIYYLMSVYRLHKILRQTSEPKYPITPWKAVLFKFIPFYGFYWAFKWPGEIATFLNFVRKEERFGPSRYGWALFSSMYIGLILPGVAQIMCFAVIGRLSKHIRTTLSTRTLPVQGYESPRYRCLPGKIMAWVASILTVVLVIGFFVMMAALKKIYAANAVQS